MTFNAPVLLVVGSGSIGKRHAKNLVALGVKVLITDVDVELAKRVANECNCQHVESIDHGLSHSLQAALVCTPNNTHIKVATKIANAGVNLFIEKPLSHNLEGVQDLIDTVTNKGLIAMSGFNLRYEPGIEYLKRSVNPYEIAHVFVESASYLPEWRSGVDYRKTYSANSSMGGGIILDDVHEIDYIHWIFGSPEKIIGAHGRFGKLDIDVEDTSDIIFVYKDKQIVMHADYLQRKYTRRCKIISKSGYSTEWFFADKVEQESIAGKTLFGYKDKFQINDMYVAEMRDFLNHLKKGEKPESDLDNAFKILKVAIQIRDQGNK